VLTPEAAIGLLPDCSASLQNSFVAQRSVRKCMCAARVRARKRQQQCVRGAARVQAQRWCSNANVHMEKTAKALVESVMSRAARPRVRNPEAREENHHHEMFCRHQQHAAAAHMLQFARAATQRPPRSGRFIAMRVRYSIGGRQRGHQQ